jgi:dTDP-4-dehydrorhamnose reductase
MFKNIFFVIAMLPLATVSGTHQIGKPTTAPPAAQIIVNLAEPPKPKKRTRSELFSLFTQYLQTIGIHSLIDFDAAVAEITNKTSKRPAAQRSKISEISLFLVTTNDRQPQN